MAKFPTIDEFAKKVAESALDDFEYKGKTVREWAELILRGELVEVVRCKDCKRCGFCGEATNLEAMGFYGFCSRGERKEE